MKITPGTRLGPYEIISPIGAGGMGEVWRGRDTRLDRPVAIKVLPPWLAEDAQFRRRFEREAKTISQLSHPNICTLYDVGENYLVMELLDGETLADRLARGSLPLRDALRFGIQIAEALDKAHRAGIVHRDLKPGNIMITSSGAKLLDFGLAKNSAGLLSSESAATRERSLTAEGAIVGTIQYMSPEQIESGEVDARSDIFAFGAVLYEMVSGRRAFEGSSQASVMAAILKSEPIALKSIAPVTPTALDRLIRKCLEKDPAQRWQSLRDLADELRWIANDLTSGPAPTPRGRKWTVAWSVAIAVVVLAAIAVMLWRGAADRSARAGPPLVVLLDSPNPERVYSSITRANGGTNADDLTNVLRDLPVTLVKETTNALWNREDQVLKERPSLVVMHRGAFSPSAAVVPDPKMLSFTFTLGQGKVEAFIGYVGLGSPDTKFIVYSRQWANIGGGPLWVSEMEKRFPHLRGRLSTFDAVCGPEPSFRESACAEKMRKQVIETLRLDVRR